MSSPELSKVMPMGDQQYRLGYFINVLLSEDACAALRPVQDKLDTHFPNALYNFGHGNAHLTVMDWVTPMTEYGCDKDALFRELAPVYNRAMDEVLKDQPPITVTFDRLEVYPAAVVVRGHDDGSIRRIREEFLQRITLEPGTREQEPSFIHSTISRFTKEVDLAATKDVVAQQTVHFEEHIPQLWLARETKLYMQDYDVIRRFPLYGS